MNRESYELLEKYMLSSMEDSAHDREHVYRVLFGALEIAKAEKESRVDYDVLIASCLLHDIGRKEQFENPALCHAAVGGNKAYDFLLRHGFPAEYAEKVRHCIRTHRYRKNEQPESLEAKILFDADKLDVSGAMGIARSLIYKGIVSEPLYSFLPDGTVSGGDGDSAPSFFQEYKYKLEKLYSDFYTPKAAEMAKERQKAAVDFYNSLYEEASALYRDGRSAIDRILR